MDNKTYWTEGKSWNGFIEFNGEVMAYAEINRFGDSWIERTGGGVSNGEVHAHFWLAPEHPIPADLRDKLWGWVKWDGGDCPLPEGTTCWVRFRDGEEFPHKAGHGLDDAWEHYGGQTDIIAYSTSARV